MGKPFTHRDLIVWQRAQQLAFEIVQLVDAFPNGRSAAVIGNQVVRSSCSIAANIAEGHGRFTSGANANHLMIARGSAAETDSWLDMMPRMKFINVKTEERLRTECGRSSRCSRQWRATIGHEMRRQAGRRHDDPT